MGSYKEKTKLETYFSYPHMNKLIDSLKTARDWLYNEDIFCTEETDEGDFLVVSSAYKNEFVKVEATSSSIFLVPDVVQDKEGTEVVGIRIAYDNSEQTSIQLTFEEFEALCYFVENFDLTLNCQMLVNCAIMAHSSKIIEGGESIKIAKKPVIRKPIDRKG